MPLFLETLGSILTSGGFMGLTVGNMIMIVVALVLLYLAIGKGFEPLLLVGIAFGCLLANIPGAGISDEGGLLYYFYKYGLETEIMPCLIFLGIGALTDFTPLLARPVTFLLGAAAQFGVFFAMFLADMLGFGIKEAASIGIIGGADGPTAIYLTVKLAPHLLGAVVVAAYSYMSLVPLIQPPVIRLLTTQKERETVMEYPKPVSKITRILFPIVTTIVTCLLLPDTTPLIGCLMLGNLLRESGVTDRLFKTAQGEMINIVTILLTIAVGGTMGAETFLTAATLKIIALGAVAFAASTAGGVLLGKLFYVLSGGKINPIIGAAGVSAVPMAARVSQVEGQKANPENFLLMHAMGPNVAGVIGTAVAAGCFLALLG
ncbi:MAG TPA: sodium ion-translocating decarboxylase subunit beta [Bacillota bacterium]|nr:sodium ion-translocating decarboxylase subunit beta [Bacillota bacterium]HPO79962.1 sodium ion-translocating decarboxylase subunit beta [Bacillota bacterium]